LGKSSIAKKIQEQLDLAIMHAKVDHFLELFDFESFKTGVENLEAVETGFSLLKILLKICVKIRLCSIRLLSPISGDQNLLEIILCTTFSKPS
jgi:hypothetical protein